MLQLSQGSTQAMQRKSTRLGLMVQKECLLVKHNTVGMAQTSNLGGVFQALKISGGANRSLTLPGMVALHAVALSTMQLQHTASMQAYYAPCLLPLLP